MTKQRRRRRNDDSNGAEADHDTRKHDTPRYPRRSRPRIEARPHASPLGTATRGGGLPGGGPGELDRRRRPPRPALPRVHRTLSGDAARTVTVAGAPSPLDEELLGRIRRFMHEHGITFYSEHLSYCGDDGHLYDLMPIPFTDEAVHYVAGRIRRAQEILGQRIAVENVSYYAMPDRSLSEAEFLRAVLEEADCDLLLDVNNIVVNAINHGYDAMEFLEAVPAERVAYLHVAGHYVEAEDLRVDTHGAAVSDPVWQLLAHTYERLGPLPTLLERDFNFPPLDELLGEVRLVRRLQQDPAALSRAETEAVHG